MQPKHAAHRLVNARKVKVIAHQIQFAATDLNVEYKTAITHWDSSLDIIVVTKNNNR